MRRMTCRNGFVFVAAICLGLMATYARAGTNNFLVSPYSPTNPASAMFTLNDIYNKLDTRAAVSMRTNAFTEASAPANATMHTLDAIMTLVTNRAPVWKTGQTISYTPYDDGWYSTNVGVAWPNPRFSVVGLPGTPETNQIRDNLTGLIWARDANLFGLVFWGDAVTNCNNLNTTVPYYGGTNDWRLPNRTEMFILLDAGRTGPMLCNTEGTGQWTENNPFSNVKINTYYWSSTTTINTTTYAWYVGLNTFGSYKKLKTTSTCYVWPVRGGLR